MHDYAYAHGDPVNRRDPGGKFSMAGTISGLNIAANLTTAFQIGYQLGSGEFEGAATDLLISMAVSKLGGGTARAVIAKSANLLRMATKGRRTVDLYRAVGVREFEAVMAKGTFKPGGNSLEGRQFAFTMDEAIKYADTDLSKVAIIKVTVDEKVLKSLDFSRTIDPFIFKNGVITVQPSTSELFHSAIQAINHVF